MTPTWIKNATVIQPGESAAAQSALFAERVTALLPASASAPAEAVVIDGRGKVMTPGLVDLHTHGLGNHIFEASGEDLIEGLKLAPRFGSTSVLPTLYSTLRPGSLDKIAELAAAITKITSVHVPGFHMEGPFLALAGAGGMTLPGDVKFLDELLSAANGRVTAMSLSPEVSGIDKVIERLVAAGIVPFLTHTRASAEQTQAAVDAGARHATHFYDVFPVPEETEPGARPVGAVEVLLGDPRATVDFIADGVHVHPAAIRAALAAKGATGVCVITDSNIGAGLPDNIYDCHWGYPVKVTVNNAARINDPKHPLFGALAGSSLTMNRAVKNLHQWIQRPTHELWAMASANPARVVGQLDRGVIRENAHADLVLWNDDFTPHRVWLGGRLVYKDEQ